MSDHDIETAHEIDENDQQLTTKRVHVDGDLVLQGESSDERLRSSAWEFVDCWR